MVLTAIERDQLKTSEGPYVLFILQHSDGLESWTTGKKAVRSAYLSVDDLRLFMFNMTTGHVSAAAVVKYCICEPI
jgi:hypothetical protein